MGVKTPALDINGDDGGIGITASVNRPRVNEATSSLRLEDFTVAGIMYCVMMW